MPELRPRAGLSVGGLVHADAGGNSRSKLGPIPSEIMFKKGFPIAARVFELFVAETSSTPSLEQLPKLDKSRDRAGSVGVDL